MQAKICTSGTTSKTHLSHRSRPPNKPPASHFRCPHLQYPQTKYQHQPPKIIYLIQKSLWHSILTQTPQYICIAQADKINLLSTVLEVGLNVPSLFNVSISFFKPIILLTNEIPNRIPARYCLHLFPICY